MYPPVTQKHKASALLAIVLMATVVSSLISVSLAKSTQVSNNAILSNKVAVQAKQYAESEAELLKSVSYTDLSGHGRTNIASTGFQSDVSLSDESNYSAFTKQRIATIKVYKGQEVLPRAELNVIRYSTEVKAASGVPIGTIIAWISYNNPTDGTWLDCNGQSCASFPALVSVLGRNTVPDFRNRFLEGSSSPGSYVDAGLPNITGAFHAHCIGYGLGWGNGAFYTTLNSDREADGNGWDNGSPDFHFDASRSNPIYGRSSTVQPPAVTVRWLIKAA